MVAEGVVVQKADLNPPLLDRIHFMAIGKEIRSQGLGKKTLQLQELRREGIISWEQRPCMTIKVNFKLLCL